MNNKGFTLVEIIVVIAIIGILSTIAMVSLGGMRERAQIATGKSFDSQIARTIGLSLLSKWSLNSDVADDQNKEKNKGVIIGGVTEIEGITKNALKFNGTNGLIRFPSSFFATTPTEFTVSFWAKPAKIPSSDAILFYSTRNVEFAVGYSTQGKFYTSYKLNPSGWESVAAQNTSQPDKWYHIAMSWSPNKVVLYINGAVIGERKPTGKVFATTPSGYPAFGAFVRPTGTTGYFPGILDEISLYTEAIPRQ